MPWPRTRTASPGSAAKQARSRRLAIAEAIAVALQVKFHSSSDALAVNDTNFIHVDFNGGATIARLAGGDA